MIKTLLADRASESWFQKLFGFEETAANVRRFLSVEGGQLVSAKNGRRFDIGEFSTPTVAALREQAQGLPKGKLSVRHYTFVGDVLKMHALPENAGATFQVASQFNCLEFVGPSVTPEHGVTGYVHDMTQGPACALAAGAATVYRNYFVPLPGGLGQTEHRQIDMLAGLADLVGKPDDFWVVRNGYVFSSEEQLKQLSMTLDRVHPDAATGAIRVGVQTGVGVTFSSRFEEPTTPTHVNQVFCSAISCGYSRSIPLDAWERLATTALDAAYEATLLAAALHSPGRRAKVWLTFVGGGVFGNKNEWISNAIQRAIARCENYDLDVCIAHYGRGVESIQNDIPTRDE